MSNTERRKSRSRQKHKSAVACWLEYSAFLALRRMALILPLRATNAAANILGRAAFLILRTHRRRTIQHILLAGVADSPAAAKHVASRSFVHLAQTGLEILKLDQFARQHDLTSAITNTYSEGVQALLQSEKGFILVSAHFGNWELGGLLWSYFEKPLHAIMRPLSNPKLNDWITERRARYGQTVLGKRGAVRQLLRVLKSGGNVALIVDQRANRVEGVMTEFFGKRALSHPAPALLHLKTGAPLIVVVCQRRPGSFQFELVGRGPFSVEPSGEKARDVQALTQLYTSEIEKIIREDPTQWLWTARRWEATRESKQGPAT